MICSTPRFHSSVVHEWPVFIQKPNLLGSIESPYSAIYRLRSWLSFQIIQPLKRLVIDFLPIHRPVADLRYTDRCSCGEILNTRRLMVAVFFGLLADPSNRLDSTLGRAAGPGRDVSCDGDQSTLVSSYLSHRSQLQCLRHQQQRHRLSRSLEKYVRYPRSVRVTTVLLSTTCIEKPFKTLSWGGIWGGRRLQLNPAWC